MAKVFLSKASPLFALRSKGINKDDPVTLTSTDGRTWKGKVIYVQTNYLGIVEIEDLKPWKTIRSQDDTLETVLVDITVGMDRNSTGGNVVTLYDQMLVVHVGPNPQPIAAKAKSGAKLAKANAKTKKRPKK